MNKNIFYLIATIVILLIYLFLIPYSLFITSPLLVSGFFAAIIGLCLFLAIKNHNKSAGIIVGLICFVMTSIIFFFYGIRQGSNESGWIKTTAIVKDTTSFVYNTDTTRGIHITFTTQNQEVKTNDLSIPISLHKLIGRNDELKIKYNPDNSLYAKLDFTKEELNNFDQQKKEKFFAMYAKKNSAPNNNKQQTEILLKFRKAMLDQDTALLNSIINFPFYLKGYNAQNTDDSILIPREKTHEFITSYLQDFCPDLNTSHKGIHYQLSLFDYIELEKKFIDTDNVVGSIGNNLILGFILRFKNRNEWKLDYIYAHLKLNQIKEKYNL